MTNYGTIPTSNTVPNLEYISKAKDHIRTSLTTRRPWKLMFNYHSFKLPSSLSLTLSRIRKNTTYFRMNYAIIMLFILFLSLLWHPVSLIVFVVCMAAWLFLYFLRDEDEPLVLFNKVVDDRVVLIFLAVLSVVVLLLTRVTVNVVVALAVGVVVVLVHAGLTRMDEDDGESAGFLAAHGNSSSS